MMAIALQLEPKIASRLSTQAAQERSTLEAAIVSFCQRWQIEEFYLFGSVLRDDFRPDSDIDVMVKFLPSARWGFEIVDIKEELEKLFERKVDLLTKASIEGSHNWLRRKEILGTARLLYVSG